MQAAKGCPLGTRKPTLGPHVAGSGPIDRGPARPAAEYDLGPAWIGRRVVDVQRNRILGNVEDVGGIILIILQKRELLLGEVLRDAGGE